MSALRRSNPSPIPFRPKSKLTHIPVVDLSRLNHNSTHRPLVLKDIARACRKHGYFQVRRFAYAGFCIGGGSVGGPGSQFRPRGVTGYTCIQRTFCAKIRLESYCGKFLAPKLQLCVFLALLNMKKLCGNHSAMQVSIQMEECKPKRSVEEADAVKSNLNVK